MQDRDDVGPREDRAELEGDLVCVGVGGELAFSLGLASGLVQQLAPLALVGRDAVAYAPGARAELGRGHDEEAAPREYTALDV